MLSEGTAAPLFELPALVDGERKRVGLSDYLGEDVVILAFYPADFNPACDDTACDLDELDLFTMQKDVTILGISTDSVYSHRAFADRYDLKIPLLSDTDHDVAREYGIDFVDDIGQQLIERAVVVIDHDGEIQYAWSTDDLRQLPRVEEIKDAIADTGGDDTAFARYRVGHAHYTEGRRAFTAAMGGFQDSEWMVAQGDFQQAREEFEDAADHFDTAVRFVDDEALKPIYEDAKTKANSLWQASDWLAQAASAYSSGSGAEGQALRDDAERPLETARGYEEPPDPDGPWPPELETLETESDDERPAYLSQDAEEGDTSLDVDIDAAVERTATELAETASSAGESALDSTSSTDATDATDAADGIREAADETTGSAAQEATAAEPAEQSSKSAGSPGEATTPADQSTPDEPAADDPPPDSVSSPDGEGELSEVDDTDIEEIQAELAESEAESESSDSIEEAPTAMVEAPPEAVGGADADSATQDTPDGDQSSVDQPSDADSSSGSETSESAELDLTDPTAAADAADESAGDSGPNDASDPETDGSAGSETDGSSDHDSGPVSDRDTTDDYERDT
ncbi:redoxin domain-containing protein [Haloarcula sp. S1AR25-5A]|uniref:thioredoxin-dependent peroxiredoxin n=1 Tax=Haloarcula terrestris TaxID=2950533 RepID=A0AAE4JFH6_9EURY|nr:redoxin domain-containing protein [Haloarcula terrestris]MDS0220323.1 redoxin domain-containing protein [Haloarcula terrestris]